MEEKRTWELSLVGDCITNGTESFDPNLWGEILRVLNALEQAKDAVERERERFREGLEQIGCWERLVPSDDYNRAWDEAAAYANKVIDGTIGSTLDYVIAQQEAAELRATNANTRALDLQVQLAAVVKERDEALALKEAHVGGRINQGMQDSLVIVRLTKERNDERAKAQRYREALEAVVRAGHGEGVFRQAAYQKARAALAEDNERKASDD